MRFQIGAMSMGDILDRGLKLLLVLTIADIKAVGPGTWTAWKATLLRTLYYETEMVLSGGRSEIPRTAQWSGGESATRSPTRTRDTSGPTSTTSPTTSCPKTNGVETNGEK